MNSTSSGARVEEVGGGGGRPRGGGGRDRPIEDLAGSAPLPLIVGRLGADIDPMAFGGLVGAEPFRWGFFASGLGNEDDDTSEGLFEGTTLGGMATSLCRSGLGSCRGFAVPVGVGLELPLTACIATGTVGVGRAGSETGSLTSGLIFGLSSFSFLILGLGGGRGVSTGAGRKVLASYWIISQA